jgi:hypothetical protein
MENPNELQDEMIKRGIREINWTNVGMYGKKTKIKRRVKATD